MTRVKGLINSYNLSPVTRNVISIDLLFRFFTNPLFNSLSVFYILINKSLFGEIFFYHSGAAQLGPECATNSSGALRP